MKQFPKINGEYSLVVRTDFSDESAWRSLCAAIETPVGEFQAYVRFVSDPAFDGLDAAGAVKSSQKSGRLVVFLADQTSMSHPEHPVDVVNVYDNPGRAFRVIPSAMWSVENNLRLCNMDFDDFASAVDPDGVFRGFPQS